jgi:glutamate dehydrogenase
MALRTDDEKRAILTAVSALAATRLEIRRAVPVQRFLAQFYDHIAADDLADRTAEDLYGAALSLWEFAQQREPGKARLRVFNPRAATEGWNARHTIVEIVNDDMPFLVDSVSMALQAEGVAVHLVIHPVASVARDRAGFILALPENGATEGARESLMHVEISEVIDPARLAAIATRLDAALEDTRAAVADWRKMRDVLAETRASLESTRAPLAKGELAEALDFLAWLEDDNFTFLGCRDYHFDESGSGIAAGLGIMRDPSYVLFGGLRNFNALSPEAQAFLRASRALIITKSQRRATVHRPVRMDAIGVKLFGPQGAVIGMRVFLGLFTSLAYSRAASATPFLRLKVAGVLRRSGFDPQGHDGKALAHILETYPRDELFQISGDELYDIAIGILGLHDRQRVALFTRRDPFERFVSCLIYVPREHYGTALRQNFAAILELGFGARVDGFRTLLDDEVLARVHFLLRTEAPVREADTAAIERALAYAARSWPDKLGDALIGGRGEAAALVLTARYGNAFPSNYRERYPVTASLGDIDRIEEVRAGTPLSLSLYRPDNTEHGALRFKLYRAAAPCALADVLPILEDMGLKAITEEAFEIRPQGDAEPVWLQDFGLASRFGDFDIAAEHRRFEEAFAHIWLGHMESDGFNRLVLAAGLGWRQVTVLRLYAKAMRQAGSPYSQSYMEDALAHYTSIAGRLATMFEARFDPAQAGRAVAETERRVKEITQELDKVESLDEDRILRGFLRLIEKSLRTNYFQRQADGLPKPYLSVKLSSREIELFPQPRPLCEIYVYSPRMEGVHLRSGKVARGGIRWSDRKEDFRTEILALMKAQVVKNAVIVPTGSKGGFVVKRMPGLRAEQPAEVVECYKTLMRGMLDITDNIVGGELVPPQDVVRHDDDDPYLVVAADKGTTTFSDIANSVSAEYGFWLGDAFASGGSAGYDHKAIGITARGAWELMKRHFRELGTDIQASDFTCAGVGDMAGDVFGNGMLRSPHTKLIAAFDHLHIFLDPDPDPAKSFTERQRLFHLPRSSWSDYEKSLISEGGGVFERSAKSIPLSPEIRVRLDIKAERLTPAELIQAILKAPVDLLFFGGIGTFVKASSETHADAGDKSNDVLRIDASDIRAKVVGEGANLGVTQKGRIEYALKGGRIDTDAIDNSAGVDTSDHEVNLKILLNGAMAAGQITLDERNALLQQMRDDVAAHVLQDNYLQGLALSLTEFAGAERIDSEARLIRDLEREGRLDRAIEFLPSDDALATRAQDHQPLTRPELSVLLAYAKNTLADDLIASDFPDDPQLEADLFGYFPSVLRERFRDEIAHHRLRRELIAMLVANDIVNRAGITFPRELAARSGRSVGDVARAYIIVRQVFGVDALWAAINALDNKVPAQVQLEMICIVRGLLERVTAWFLAGSRPDIREQIEANRPGIARLAEHIGELIPPSEKDELARQVAAFVEKGGPPQLALRVARLNFLLSSVDIVRLAKTAQRDLLESGQRFFAIGARFKLDELRAAARKLLAETQWQKLAISALIDDLYAHQADLTGRALARGGDFQEWLDGHARDLGRLDALVREIEAATQPDLAMLTVANRALRGFLVE